MHTITTECEAKSGYKPCSDDTETATECPSLFESVATSNCFCQLRGVSDVICRCESQQLFDFVVWQATFTSQCLNKCLHGFSIDLCPPRQCFQLFVWFFDGIFP